MLKRLAAVGLTLACVALAGCFAGDSSNESSDKGADGPVEGTLTMWLVPPEGKVFEWWQDFARDFEAKHPEAKIGLTRYSTDEYFPKTLAAFSSGNPPDVFESPSGELVDRYWRVGKLAELNDLVDFKRFNPAFVEPFTSVGGEIYGVPESPWVVALFYNKDLFANAGVEVPKRWPQLLDACEKLNAEGVAPIALGNAGQDVWTAQFYFESLLYQYAGNEAAFNSTYGVDGASWTDEAVVKAATSLKQLIDAQCFPRGFSGLSYNQMASLYLSGKAAMIFEQPILASGLDDVEFEPGVFPFPDADGGEHSTASLEGIVGGVQGLAVSSQAADSKPALVSAFLNALGDKANDYAIETNQPSAAAKPGRPANPLLAEVVKVVNGASELAPGTDAVVGSAIHDDYFNNLYALTTGKLSPEEFAQKMQEAVENEAGNLPEIGQ